VDLYRQAAHGLTLGALEPACTSLRAAKLFGADLRDAHLDDADLTGASLARANMDQATLCRANLSQADLTFASLLAANLQGAWLFGTRLGRVALNGPRPQQRDANLRGARYDGTTRWPAGFDPRARGAILVPAPPIRDPAAAAQRGTLPH